jgi:hypothetical protein
MRKSVPTVALLGWGRAGKDEAGIWLGKNTALRYVGSSSNVACPMIAAELGITEEEAWNTRHQNRAFWKDWADKYRGDDGSKLCRAILEKGDIVVGLRDKFELDCCKREGLLDIIVWIDRPVPQDFTVTFSVDDCDIVIRNHGTIEEFHQKLQRWVDFSGIPLKTS